MADGQGNGNCFWPPRWSEAKNSVKGQTFRLPRDPMRGKLSAAHGRSNHEVSLLISSGSAGRSAEISFQEGGLGPTAGRRKKAAASGKEGVFVKALCG